MNKTHDQTRREAVDETLKMVSDIRDVLTAANVDPSNKDRALRVIKNSYLRGAFATHCYLRTWARK